MPPRRPHVSPQARTTDTTRLVDSNGVAVWHVVCSMCLNFITRDIYHLWFDLPLQT